MEGTITPDEDLSQKMGDTSLDITEDMRDKANEERTNGSMAMAEGRCLLGRRGHCTNRPLKAIAACSFHGNRPHPSLIFR
jgi:hypothetical protein